MISVIIPNYNRAKVISRAIESVLDQTFSDFELIVVDDCSTDNSMQVISLIQDKRIKVFQLKENSGAAAARNYGIKQSSGDFISFLDSDDYFEPRFLEVTYEMFAKTGPSVGFMWTGLRYHLEDDIIEMSWQPERKNNPYLTFLNERSIGTGSGLTLKKEVFEQCGNFKENLKAAEDTEFFLRITKSFNYCFTKEILINIEKIGGDRMSKNYKNIGLAYNLFIVDHLSEIDKDKELQMKFYYKLMWLNYNADDKVKARQYFRKIPLANFRFFVKSCLLFVIYESLNLNAAKKVHTRFSAQ